MQQFTSKHKCEDAGVHAAAIGIGVATAVDWNEWRSVIPWYQAIVLLSESQPAQADWRPVVLATARMGNPEGQETNVAQQQTLTSELQKQQPAEDSAWGAH